MNRSSLEMIEIALTRTLIVSMIIFAVLMNLFFLAYHNYYAGLLASGTVGDLRQRQSIVIGSTILLGFLAWIIGRIVSIGLIRHFRGNIQKVASFVKDQNLENISEDFHIEDLPSHDELNEIARAVTEKNKQIKADMQTLKEFIAHVQHEFKTPLASLLVTNELALEVGHDEKTIQKNIKIAKQLNRLLDSLLLLVNRPREQARKIECNLVELVESVAENLEDRYQKGVMLKIRGKDNAKITTREGCIENIIINILDNARKYSPTEGRVYIALKANGIKISDEGPGIEESDLHRVREPFWQKKKSQGKENGFGLGLAIVKKYSEMLGRNIQMKSKKNKGTSFIIDRNDANH